MKRKYNRGIGLFVLVCFVFLFSTLFQVKKASAEEGTGQAAEPKQGTMDETEHGGDEPAPGTLDETEHGGAGTHSCHKNLRRP